MPKTGSRRPLRTGRGRSELERKQQRLAVAIFVGAGAVISGLLFVLSVGAPPATDPETGCLVGVKLPSQNTLVLIDQTDPLTHAQITYAKALIWSEYNRLGFGGRLSVRGISSDPDAATRELVRCRIQTVDEIKNRPDVNPEFVEEDFEKIVGKPINTYVGSLQNIPSNETSPIAETLVSVMDEDDFDPEVHSRRLVVLSDMAQNSTQYSQYPHGRGSHPWEELPSLSVRQRFKGVQVRVHYIERRELPWQGEAHQQAWRQFFGKLGATDVAIGWGRGLGESAP